MRSCHTRLVNGMHVASEHMTGVETVSLGIFLPRGSRHEPERSGGITHFIEHMLFKGTAARSARGIAEATDAVGGVLDAYTAKEETCFSFKVRNKHLETMLDILADMMQNPAFTAGELDRERMVILEEIKMEEDNPEDLVHEKNIQEIWAGHPMGAPILGTHSSVQALSREEIVDFHQRQFRNAGMVVTAAGSIDHDWLCDAIAARFPGSEPIPEASPAAAAVPVPIASQRFVSREHLEQVNFCISFDAPAYPDEARETLYLLSSVLGGSMSSRLFQKIREEHGLAYTIGSFANTYSDCGLLTIYGGCSPDRFETVVALVLGEIAALRDHGVPSDELARAREQLIGNTLMGLETTGSRSAVLARELMLRGRLFDLEETVARMEAVDGDRVLGLARHIFRDARMGLTAVGRLSGHEPMHSYGLDAPLIGTA